MADYIYSREIVNGSYNIDNINHKDGGAEPVPLRNEIKAEPTLPDEFRINCNGSTCAITFVDPLTGEQETTLTGIVAYQKTDN